VADHPTDPTKQTAASRAWRRKKYAAGPDDPAAANNPACLAVEGKSHLFAKVETACEPVHDPRDPLAATIKKPLAVVR
jgi:hypothetical protein